jgi:D-aspartate ligase
MTQRAAVVMCGGGPGAYDIVRALGKAGVRSVVFSSQAHDIALHSRYTQGSLLLPEFKAENFRAILERVMAFGAEAKERPVLFYAGDSEVMFMARFRDQLAHAYEFTLPPKELLESLLSKSLFVELARTANLPMPPTRAFATPAELQAEIAAIAFPCMVKPAYSQDWFWETEELHARFGRYKEALRRFDSPQDLLAFCAGLPARPGGFIVQSYIDGRDDTTVCFHGYFDEQSKCLGCFLTREIRTSPPHTGDIAYCKTFHDEELVRLSIGHLQRIGFRGIVKVDYRWDARDREFKILEIEPHYQAWHLLGAYAGVNLASIAYRHHLGEPLEQQMEYSEDARLLHFSEDLKAYLSGYRKTKEWTWASYLGSLWASKHYRIYDPVDPLPFVYSLAQFLARKSARIVGWDDR